MEECLLDKIYGSERDQRDNAEIVDPAATILVMWAEF